MTLLPYRPKPRANELFSSWLIRLANGYEMELFTFLDLLGLSSHLQSSDIDWLAPESLLIRLAELTGADVKQVRRTLLRERARYLQCDEVQIETVARPWMIPIGRSRRFGRTSGFQVCPTCLASEPPFFKWQWSSALFCCCQLHGTLLIDSCPGCSASLYASPQGLLGARRTSIGAIEIRLERCTMCGFDLRRACPPKAPEALLGYEAAYESELATAEKGSESPNRFSILRHLITLLFAENRGLETLRRIVCSRSGVTRVDIPIPYEPDQDIVPFEEADAATRATVSLAAGWLFQDWPNRFIECCHQADVQYPALNRNAISVRSFFDVTTAAYDPGVHSVRRKPVRGATDDAGAVRRAG